MLLLALYKDVWSANVKCERYRRMLKDSRKDKITNEELYQSVKSNTV